MAGIVIVDYGMANLRSVQKAFERVGAQAEITSDPDAIAKCDKLVLPGVGAFRDAIARLRETGLDKPIVEHIQKGQPFLGICLGLQLLSPVPPMGCPSPRADRTSRGRRRTRPTPPRDLRVLAQA